MRIGLIKYLNALPFHAALPSAVFDVPTTLSKLLAEKKLDLALISSIECYNKSYSYLPDLCIASTDQVLSVNLYVHQKCASLHQATIALTDESATSVALLKILAKHFWKVSPNYVPLKLPYEAFDAFLLIGDAALQYKNPAFHTIDLAKSWFEATALPFVFALFAFPHESTKKQEITGIAEKLRTSLSNFEENKEKILNCIQSTIPKDFLERYYHCLHYRLEDKQQRSLKLFYDYLSQG